jgi:hypothetical protein
MYKTVFLNICSVNKIVNMQRVIFYYCQQPGGLISCRDRVPGSPPKNPALRDDELDEVN